MSERYGADLHDQPSRGVVPRSPASWRDACQPSSGRAAERSRGVARLVGDSRPMRDLKARIRRLAASPFPVVIHGESGTGKELIARAIHEEGPRGHAVFVPVNCAILGDELFESELFGHAKGAFTSASRDRKGLLELSSGGTVFLDEVTELSPGAQAKLLRVLQDGEVRRLGENRTQWLDLRVVAATNRPLDDEAAAGPLPKGSAVSPQGPRAHRAPVARPHARHRAAHRPLLGPHERVRGQPCEPGARDGDRAGGTSVARQRPGAAERAGQPDRHRAGRRRGRPGRAPRRHPAGSRRRAPADARPGARKARTRDGDRRARTAFQHLRRRRRAGHHAPRTLQADGAPPGRPTRSELRPARFRCPPCNPARPVGAVAVDEGKPIGDTFPGCRRRRRALGWAPPPRRPHSCTRRSHPRGARERSTPRGASAFGGPDEPRLTRSARLVQARDSPNGSRYDARHRHSPSDTASGTRAIRAAEGCRPLSTAERNRS